jgi:hypothetical protein
MKSRLFIVSSPDDVVLLFELDPFGIMLEPSFRGLCRTWNIGFPISMPNSAYCNAKSPASAGEAGLVARF